MGRLSVGVKTMKECGNMEKQKTQKRRKYRWWECGMWENADFGNADGRGFNLCVAPSLRNLVSVISELQKDFRR